MSPANQLIWLRSMLNEMSRALPLVVLAWFMATTPADAAWAFADPEGDVVIPDPGSRDGPPVPSPIGDAFDIVQVDLELMDNQTLLVALQIVDLAKVDLWTTHHVQGSPTYSANLAILGADDAPEDHDYNFDTEFMLSPTAHGPAQIAYPLDEWDFQVYSNVRGPLRVPGELDFAASTLRMSIPLKHFFDADETVQLWQAWGKTGQALTIVNGMNPSNRWVSDVAYSPQPWNITLREEVANSTPPPAAPHDEAGPSQKSPSLFIGAVLIVVATLARRRLT